MPILSYGPCEPYTSKGYGVTDKPMTFLVVISISKAFKLSVATPYMFEQMLLKWWGLGNVVFFSWLVITVL